MAKNENTVDRLLEKTPWWVVSSFFHVVIFMVAGLIFGIQVAAEEDEPVVVTPARKPVPFPVMDPPKVDDLREPLLEEIKEENVLFKKKQNQDQSRPEEEREFKKSSGDPGEIRDRKSLQRKEWKAVIGPGVFRPGESGFPGNGIDGPGFPGDGIEDFLGDPGKEGFGTETAVLNALRWLARHQHSDGSWKAEEYRRECNQISEYATRGVCADEKGYEGHDSGVTGLAVLAFLGAGYSHHSRESYDGIVFGEVVGKGIRWIMSQQDAEGAIGGRTISRWMYNHLICALALTEAYGRTGSFLVQEASQRALDFTIKAQNPGNGWRYSYRPGDNDTSVTGWATMVLKSAELGGLLFPREAAYGGAMAWFDQVTEKSYYRVGYSFAGSGKTFEPGVNEKFDGHPAMTAVTTMARMFLVKNRRSPEVAGGCRVLVRDLPKWEGAKIDFYYWYYGSLALFQYGGANWNKWNIAMKKALVPHQNGKRTGCRKGSWEPVGRWSKEGGRVYATAINALTLEVYYRYANVFTGR